LCISSVFPLLSTPHSERNGRFYRKCACQSKLSKMFQTIGQCRCSANAASCTSFIRVKIPVSDTDFSIEPTTRKSVQFLVLSRSRLNKSHINSLSFSVSSVSRQFGAAHRTLRCFYKQHQYRNYKQPPGIINSLYLCSLATNTPLNTPLLLLSFTVKRVSWG
jgi:hypothetical protein